MLSEESPIIEPNRRFFSSFEDFQISGMPYAPSIRAAKTHRTQTAILCIVDPDNPDHGRDV